MTKKQIFTFAYALFGLGMTAAVPATAATVTTNFADFPGPSEILGAPDEIPVTFTFSSSSNGNQARFTNQFAELAGGLGFIVDSLCCGSLGDELGSIYESGSGDWLVQARPDVDGTAFSFGSVAIDFVSSSNGTTPTTVASVDITVPSGDGTLDFYDITDNLLGSSTVSGGGDFPFASATGIASVVFNVSDSSAISGLSFTTASTPEPAGLWLCLPALLVGLKWRRRVRTARDLGMRHAR